MTAVRVLSGCIPGGFAIGSRVIEVDETYRGTWSDAQLELRFDAPVPGLLTPDEIYANADQALLERLREDRRIERKPATISAAAPQMREALEKACLVIGQRGTSRENSDAYEAVCAALRAANGEGEDK